MTDPRGRDRWVAGELSERASPRRRQSLPLPSTRLIERLEPPAPLTFRSNHASNALALAGVLPRDRTALLDTLATALAGHLARQLEHKQ